MAVIFDRDGVLIKDTHFRTNVDDLSWTPGALDLVAELNRSGIKVGVATNQSGVARGLFDEETVRHLHAHMQGQLKLSGAHIDWFEYCPHHPTEGAYPYRTLCSCRKPEPGMINSLLRKFQVPANRAIMIGDRQSDMIAAERAGVNGLLFLGGDLRMAVNALGWLGKTYKSIGPSV